jgi:hypothetical protein
LVKITSCWFAFLFPWSNNLHGWLRIPYVVFAVCFAFLLEVQLKKTFNEYIG